METALAGTNNCPKCGKDMAIRPGAVLRCDERECVFWRVDFPRDNSFRPKDQPNPEKW
jgi:hypothetical protein